MNDAFFKLIVNSLSRSDILEIDLKNTIVQTLISARLKRNMNRAQFAEFMGVSEHTVLKWESGECDFQISTIAKICAMLGITPCLKMIEDAEE